MGVKDLLVTFLPNRHVVEKDGHYTFEDAEQTIGSVKAFYGNFLVVVRALCYMKMLAAMGCRMLRRPLS